ncbi:MAG: hypothetical protein ACR2K0_00675 [Acidimicrobiales bacterium]
MLVLISFGLVLVATVLLVLGLVAGSGLALIYVSMACSVVAGVVLVVATVTRRQPAETTAAAGGTEAWARQEETASMGAAVSTTTAPVPMQAPPPAYTPATRQPAMASVGASGAAPSGGGTDDDFFPIEDYDELTIGEILPLLPELYSDELDIVEAHERGAKARVSVLDRIEELRSSSADDVGEGGVAEAPAGTAEPDADFFPIEDYDELNVADILPLLPELYPEELDEVEAHERAGKGRVSIINRITELRSQLVAAPEAEPPAQAVDDDRGAPDDADFFPIEDYDELTVGEILPLLPELYADELNEVEDRERSTKSRAVILNRLGELRETAEAGEPDTAVSAATGPEEEPDFFPIEDYDELNEGEILPLLPELYADELDEVEDRERSTKNRAAILDRLGELRASGPGEPEEGEAVRALPADAEDDELFPIAEYDELTEAEILPLLAELYDDELDVVEDRERATKNRAAVLDGLADLRQGPGTTEVVMEPEGDWEVPDEGWAPRPEAHDEDLFPIADYDNLRVPEIRAVLRELSQDELERVRDRELEGANRRMVLAAIYRELGVEAPAPARKSSARKAAAKTAPARKAVARKAPAKKAAAKKTAAKKTAAKKTAAKKTAARKTAAKKAPAKAKKAPAKKTAAKKTAAKKTAAKKAPAKKAPARKATSRRR